MTAEPALRRTPRLAVVGQFRMVVEAVARTFDDGGRVRTVVLDRSLAASAARDAVLRERVDVVVLVTGPEDTIDAVDIVRALATSQQRVVVTVDRRDHAIGRELLAAGAMAYLVEGAAAMRHVVAAAVLQRRPRRSASEPTALAPSPERQIRRNLTTLSSAEERILWRLMHGASVADIARAHVVSAETVRSQIRTVLVKTESPSRLTAVVRAWQVGWRPASSRLPAA